ncbi:MAG: phage head closure protein [Vicinamibacteria bacterium]|nr:phage head closure protein [Vicinamibacteria bacterium]
MEILVLEEFRDPLSGELKKEWALLAKSWARVLPGTGAERYGDQQLVATNATRFRMRGYRDDVTPLNRLRYRGREYDIHGVQEIGRREGLEVLAEARAE